MSLPIAATPLDLAGSVLLFVAAGLSAGASVSARRRGGTFGNIRLWRVAAAFLLLAGVYRAVGAEHYLTDRLRAAATGEGWYGDRRIGQALITSVGVVVSAAVFWMGLRYRANWRVRLAAISLIGYVVLSMVRLVSLHMVDGLLYRSMGPIHANWLFELALVGTLCACAVATILQPERPERRRDERRRH